MATEIVSALGEGFLTYSDRESRARALQMTPTDLCMHMHGLFALHAEFITYAEQLQEMAVEHFPEATDGDRTRALLRALGRQIAEVDKVVAEIAGSCEAALLRLDGSQAPHVAEVSHD
jgi:hypothetical protein